MKEKFKSALQLLEYYKSHEKCLQLLEQQRWGGTPVCPHCGSVKTPYKIEFGKRYKCSEKGCNKKFSVLVGTIFENTKIDLRYWFAAIYLVSSHKKGISSHQLARDLGITQKSAWFVLHRIREMLKSEGELLTGEVEVDETFVGGKEKNKHGYYGNVADKQQNVSLVYRSKPITPKTPVIGALQRNGKIIVKKIDAATKENLIGFMVDNVNPSAVIYTDEHSGYKSLPAHGYKHETVSHNAGEYVRGRVSTNSIEGFWSLLKRQIIGIHHQVSPKHLQRYAIESAYRYNTRLKTDQERFHFVLTHPNKRLRWNDLTGRQ